MHRSQVDVQPHNQEAFYALIGRVSLRLIDRNADAITVANFLREITAAGEHTLTLQRAIEIASNYVTLGDDWAEFL